MEDLKNPVKIAYETSDTHSAEAYLKRLLAKGYRLELEADAPAQ